MSEALLSGATFQGANGTKVPSPAERAGEPSQAEATDFPMVFGSMLLEGGEAAALPAALQVDPTAAGGLMPGGKNSAAPSGSLAQGAQQAGKLLPAGLPQLAFNALIAVDDGEQAAALALQGDGQALRAGPPVVSHDLTQAMRQALAQQLLHRGDAPGATPANQAFLTNPVLNPENFKLELNNLTQAFADQLARDAEADVSQGIKPGTNAASTSAGSNGSSSLNSLNAFNSQLSTAGGRTEAGAGNGVSVPPQHPQWGQQVGDRVHWMIGQNLQRADIRLNPPELGSLEVRIQLNSDQQTNISFSSPHAQVRDALEAALPRLREMMNDSGLNLANVDVSQHSFADAQTQHTDGGGADGRAGSGHAGEAGETGEEAGGANQDLRMTESTGLVDFYA